IRDDLVTGVQTCALPILSGYQGTRMTPRLGELFDPLELPGLVAEVGGSPIGLLTYRVQGDEMEALTVHAQASGRGAGSALLGARSEERRVGKGGGQRGGA